MLRTAIKAAKLAGKIIKTNFGKSIDISTKEGNEFFTSIDIEAEKNIIKTIKEKFSNHNIWSEECGSLEKTDSNYKWIIDPLDGTNNFINQIPMVGTSIGLMYKNKPVLGVVYFPMINQLFYAEKGKGAFLNGKPIKCPDIKELSKAVLFFESHLKTASPKYLKFFLTLAKKIFRTRIAGAATMNICYVANGSANICVESGLKPGDIAASSIIAEEAGAIITDHKGKPWHPRCKNIIVTNKYLHKKILELIQK